MHTWIKVYHVGPVVVSIAYSKRIFCISLVLFSNFGTQGAFKQHIRILFRNWNNEWTTLWSSRHWSEFKAIETNSLSSCSLNRHKLECFTSLWWFEVSESLNKHIFKVQKHQETWTLKTLLKLHKKILRTDAYYYIDTEKGPCYATWF